MNIDEAFEYLNKHQIDFQPEGVNFKFTYKYLKSEKDKIHEALSLTCGRHGADIYIDEMHYKVINYTYLKFRHDGDIISILINKYFGPYYAEVLLSRENNIVINANDVSIDNVEQITINTKAITSIKAKKLEIINNSYNLDKEDVLELIKIIENIECKLLNNDNQEHNDIDDLKIMAERIPTIASFLADIITIVQPFFK